MAEYGATDNTTSGGQGSHAVLMGFIESDNIAADLTDEQLTAIGEKVKREYEIDDNSRKAWLDQIDKAMDLALQVVEAKNTPWPNASNVKFPLMTSAAIQFAARAYPAIVPGSNIVKGKVIGSDSPIPPPPGPEPREGALPQQPGMEPQAAPGGPSASPGQPPGPQVGEPGMQGWSPGMAPQGPGMAPQQPQTREGEKRDRAGRIGRHMSWQLTEEMEEWEEDTDRLLHVLPIVGTLFRKTWYDPDRDRNASEMILPKDLVVNYAAKSLETAPRITQEFEKYPTQITENQRMGIWLDEDLGLPADGGDDDDAPHDFLEQHRTLDLDEDDYPEPYIVTVHKETSKVLRIVARFDADGVLINQAGEVAKIKPVEYFTKYGFIPSPDGGFYDVGFGLLLNPINAAVNTSINQMIDAGSLQNAGGGFIGSGLRIKGGVVRIKPGEYKMVDATGGTVAQNVVPLQHPGPSPVLFQLLGLLIEAGREIASIKDILTGGEDPANTSPTVVLAMVEQGMKVFTSIYKRIHRSLKHELKLIYRLNRLYLSPEVYFTLLDEPEAIAQEDYEDESMDVIPVSDPKVVTDMQQMARAQFLTSFADDPWFDGREIRRRVLEAADIEEVDKVLRDQPPENPQVVLESAKQEIEQAKVSIDQAKLELEDIKVRIAAAKQEAEEAKGETDSLIEADKMVLATAKNEAEIDKL
ncbi:hypothetical protein LCGC14_0355400 [marine sediment metagenome]|uniref:Portal protein n=1 Tax=marine sediment metagenome TaxID=412755 RepID=A0A0F9T9S9_9ZZZZ